MSTLKLKCASQVPQPCGETPTLAAVAVHEFDDGDEALYEMFAACPTHEGWFLECRPPDLPDYALIRFTEVAG